MALDSSQWNDHLKGSASDYLSIIPLGTNKNHNHASYSNKTTVTTC